MFAGRSSQSEFHQAAPAAPRPAARFKQTAVAPLQSANNVAALFENEGKEETK